MSRSSLEDRFLDKVELADDCWFWQAATDRDGYGWFKVHGRMTYAHRFSYEYFIGPIPDGLVIDHLCRNPSCVNPDHMEPVTNRVNIFRGDTPARRNKEKTHCIHGHPFTPENTAITRKGERVCRTCSRAACNRWYHQNKYRRTSYDVQSNQGERQMPKKDMTSNPGNAPIRKLGQTASRNYGSNPDAKRVPDQAKDLSVKGK